MIPCSGRSPEAKPLLQSSTMFSLEIDCAPDRLDLLIADLWEQGCAGITEIDGGRLRAFFEDAADRKLLCERYPGAVVREEEEHDWVQSARDVLQPLKVGARFFLVPEWRHDPPPGGRFRITVNPGMAFGTGVHETTQLVLEALEKVCKPGMSVLDVGTGSGILGEAAALLGAAKVFACDIDPDSIAIARQRLPHCFVGSVDAVRPHIADITLANISPETIVHLAPWLMDSLRPGGILLASGFEGTEEETIGAALPQVREMRRKGNWSLAVVYSP
jgi:ribosomal protein L11 methyltransferase